MDFVKYLFLLAAHGSTVYAQMHIYNITTAVAGLSSTCTQVMNQEISCDPLLLDSGNGRFETDNTLSTICTSICQTGLSTYLRRIAGACGTSRYDGGDGYLYLPATTPEMIYERYQSLCLKNSAGKYCNAVIRDLLGIDPEIQGPSNTAFTPASTVTCDKCFLSSISQVLVQPLSSATEFASALSDLTKQCSTTMTITVPSSTVWSTPAATTSSSGCVGTKYTIQNGDSCQSISFKSGISTSQMLTSNGLFAYCSGFPSSGTICIPDDLKCKPYASKIGDSCDSIASANKISWTQLVSWNPDLGSFCGNINRVTKRGMTLCVSNPGGSWVNPNPVTKPTTTSMIDTIFTETPTPMSMFSIATGVTALYPEETYVTPRSNGSKLDCELFASPPVLVNASARTFSYTCAAVAKAYGITAADLLYWNPGINTTGGFDDPCELSGSLQYCVQDLLQHPNDTTPYCVFPALAEPGWTCELYTWGYNISQAAFITWNPSVGTKCEKFQQGKTYCAAVEHYRPSDEISTCAYWAMANDTNPSNKPCGLFETKFNLSHARFVAWNPSLKDDCSGIVKGYDYCIGTPTIHPWI